MLYEDNSVSKKDEIHYVNDMNMLGQCFLI